MSASQTAAVVGGYGAGQAMGRASKAVAGGAAKAAVAVTPRPPARLEYTPPKAKPTAERVAPKVKPNEDASSVFGAYRGMKAARASVLGALDAPNRKKKK